MAPVASLSSGHRQAIAEDFILKLLGQPHRREFSLAEVVHRAVTTSERLSPDEVRGAAASMADEGKIRLTDNLKIRLVRTK